MLMTGDRSSMSQIPISQLHFMNFTIDIRPIKFSLETICGFLSLYIMDSFPFITPRRQTVWLYPLCLYFTGGSLVCLQMFIHLHSLFLALKACALVNRAGTE